jgi:hypothetical protein
MNTVVVGDGNNRIDARGGLSTVDAGNGNNVIIIGGSYAPRVTTGQTAVWSCSAPKAS